MKVRTLFISDLHLGSRACQASKLLEFLTTCDANTIYLIGDIIDGWRLQSKWYWPETHHAVLQHLVARAQAGTRIVYLPGNHDDFASETDIFQKLGFSVHREHEHVALNGDRYLLLHGDQFDIVERHARWLCRLGSRAYEVLVLVSSQVNRLRKHFDLDYRPYSSLIKGRVKAVMAFVSEFEQSLETEARGRGHRGVICGHIHHATLRDKEGFCYMNTGDWVESCSAIVEHSDGRFELLHWRTQCVPRAHKARHYAGRLFPRLRWALAGLISPLGASIIVCMHVAFTPLRWIRVIH